MPIIKIQHVISFSSEDSVHTAVNVLTADNGKKWKCETAGEKSASIILQLEKAYKISALDIGNEHSAFIEVLVGRSGAKDQEFQVLLVTSSFMTPMESRNSTTINRVRMFTSENFSSETRDQKWDRIKVVCTQPFNKHVQYGLSFIKIHGATSLETRTQAGSLVPKDVGDVPQLIRRVHVSKENRDVTSASSSDKAPTQMIGRFKLREDSPEDDNLGAGALFARRKQLMQNTPAAAIRDASKEQVKLSTNVITPRTKPTPKTTVVIKDDSSDEEDIKTKRNRNRDALFYDSDDDKPNERLDKLIKKDLKNSEEVKQQHKESKKVNNGEKLKIPPTTSTKFADFLGSPSSSSKTNKKAEITNRTPKNEQKLSVKTPNTTDKKATKRASTDTVETSTSKKPRLAATANKKKDPIYKPFNKLLEGVTIVISGFQNPLRGNLRQMAVSMGASYKPDWDNSCTHLICAVAHTPKYQQVQRLSGKIVKKDWIEQCHALSVRFPWRRYALNSADAKLPESEDEILDEYSRPSTSTTNENTLALYDNDNENDNGESSNTEDEIEKIINNGKQHDNDINGEESNKNKEENNSKENIPAEIDPFEADTEKEEPTIFEKLKDEYSASKNMFKNKLFHVDFKLGTKNVEKIEEFIQKHNGILIDEVNNKVDYYITNSTNDHISEKFPETEFVKPEWVYECNDMEVFVPTDKYKI